MPSSCGPGPVTEEFLLHKPKTWLECVDCSKGYSTDGADGVRYYCDCGGPLEVRYDLSGCNVSKELFDRRLSSDSNPNAYPFTSGVWRYKELVHPLISENEIVSRGEGNTSLYSHKRLDGFAGVKIIAKHEGENPTGSFKDRGMSVGITEAKRQGVKTVGCASTGNTSASLASYAALAGMKCILLIPEGKIAIGKLSQALAYGAKVFQVKGDFDNAMDLMQKAASGRGKPGIRGMSGIYSLNSVNPWRIEGQKTAIFELIQQLKWKAPDWISVPAGNLGNTSAFGKALGELKALGLIDKMPRIAAIQAVGANPFYKLFKEGGSSIVPVKADTIASAIKIGSPINWKKAIRVIKETRGVVEQVTDQEIMDAKAVIDGCGIGCEPASAASVAGVKKLVGKGVIKEDETVACVLTGNLLKDPDSTVNYHLGRLKGIRGNYKNSPTVIEPSISALKKCLG